MGLTERERKALIGLANDCKNLIIRYWERQDALEERIRQIERRLKRGGAGQ